MRPYILSVCVILLCWSAGAKGQSVCDRVVSALQKNNAVALTECLHTMVDLQIPGYNGNFSQSQASVILKKFLSEHPVSSVVITREGDTSDGSRYALGELVFGGKKHRFYVVTKETEGVWKVFLLQVMQS
ncbi:MAG: DUF4783 domain-containing protein [Bacteroidetes bacterium]|nr:MAG: DUF4783 domain-containing protein [Bacteroidota bacterium]